LIDGVAEAKGWRRDESGERLSERRAADATSDKDGEKLGGREVADIKPADREKNLGFRCR
jgi:hypothetical protein